MAPKARWGQNEGEGGTCRRQVVLMTGMKKGGQKERKRKKSSFYSSKGSKRTERSPETSCREGKKNRFTRVADVI